MMAISTLRNPRSHSKQQHDHERHVGIVGKVNQLWSEVRQQHPGERRIRQDLNSDN